MGDDEQQAEKADILINGGEPVLITDVVLAEVIWTLAGRKHQLDKEEIVNTVEVLFKEPNLQFEDDQIVWRALHAYRTAESVRAGQLIRSTQPQVSYRLPGFYEKSRKPLNKSGEGLVSLIYVI